MRSTPIAIEHAHSLAKPKVQARVVAPATLSSQQIERMYEIFDRYYLGHSFDSFLRDLLEKTHVILLVDKATDEIQGFSTLLKAEVTLENGRRAYGIYSGDTVLEKEYWGNAALGIAFLNYLWKEKIRRPWRPLFWFLISKGYKTYLLMANNFSVHYPRFEAATPKHYKDIMNAFYSQKFTNAFDQNRGVIEWETPGCRLKEAQAKIQKHHLENPRIAFFQKMNPNWEAGSELACIAEMTLLMPIKYAVKKLFKGVVK